LERTYQAINRALVDEVNAAKILLQSIENIRTSSQNGVQHDDPSSGYDRYLIQEYKIESLENSVQAMRKTFLVMIYHFWEREISKWAGDYVKIKSGESQHDAHLRHCKIEGIDVATDQMSELQAAVNLIKHGHGRREWGNRLYKLRNDLFTKKCVSNDPYDHLQIESDHVLGFFTAVRSSGPTSSSHFVPVRLRAAEGNG
jgi:hypothetical protein